MAAAKRKDDEKTNGKPRCGCCSPPVSSTTSSAPPGALSLALSLGASAKKRWPFNKLKVYFFEWVNDGRAKLVLKILNESWGPYTGLSFTRTSNKQGSQIRVSFDLKDGGAWSYIGTDANKHPNQATLNLGFACFANADVSNYSAKKSWYGTVRHEGGHAIGFIHENPGQVPWHKPTVYAFYKGPPNNWTNQDVERNLFYVDKNAKRTSFDKTSIMSYSIHESFLDKSKSNLQDYLHGRNWELSAADKAFAMNYYSHWTWSSKRMDGVSDYWMNCLKLRANSTGTPNTVVYRTQHGNGYWRTVAADVTFDAGKHAIEVKFINGWNTGIGFVTADFHGGHDGLADTNCLVGHSGDAKAGYGWLPYSNECWNEHIKVLDTDACTKRGLNKAIKSFNKGTESDTARFVLDLDAGTISIGLNGQTPIRCFTGVRGPLSPAVSLHYPGTSVELLKVERIE